MMVEELEGEIERVELPTLHTARSCAQYHISPCIINPDDGWEGLDKTNVESDESQEEQRNGLTRA